MIVIDEFVYQNLNPNYATGEEFKVVVFEKGFHSGSSFYCFGVSTNIW